MNSPYGVIGNFPNISPSKEMTALGVLVPRVATRCLSLYIIACFLVLTAQLHIFSGYLAYILMFGITY